LAFGCENEVDFVAASFVSCPEDIIEMRNFLREHGGKGIQIIAKIENTMGIRNFDEILSVADGIMVARGDLGVEVPIHEVPIFQRSIVSKCHFANKPVIVATQMLESMQYNPRPTRAEVNDVATAVLSGCDAIMLSGETASGLYPVESVTMMNTIALRMEEEINYKELMLRAQEARVNDIASIIALSVADAAHQLPVSAILTPTMSGFTARAVSHFRPKAPIIAVTMNRKVMRSLALSWGVFPILAVLQDNFENVIQQAIKEANKKFEFAPGDMVIVTAGIPLNIARTTNMMKIEIIK
jgi:pyruvate kinase